MSPGRRLRVGFDTTSLLSTRTGVGIVTDGMLDALAKEPTLDLVAFAVTWRGRQDLAGVIPDGIQTVARPFPARLSRILWPRVAWPTAEYWTGAVDVVHGPGFVAPPAHVPVVITVHDIGFIRFPELCTADTVSYARLLETAVRRGATIQTYSRFVAAEVRDQFGLADDRVVQLYPGLPDAIGGDADRGRRLAGAERYVLALGTIEPRKNLPRLVQAFDAIAERERDLVLAVAGPVGWGIEEFDEAVSHARHAGRIARLGFVADRERRDLLAGATLLAYPSLYEGFGIPPLEALQVGVPVVASDRGALPEVLGDAALLPDPEDLDGLVDALDRALHDDALRADLAARGHERVGRYTWEASIPTLLSLYRRLASVA